MLLTNFVRLKVSSKKKAPAFLRRLTNDYKNWSKKSTPQFENGSWRSARHSTGSSDIIGVAVFAFPFYSIRTVLQ